MSGADRREQQAWLATLSDEELEALVVELGGVPTAHLTGREALAVYRRWFRESGVTV